MSASSMAEARRMIWLRVQHWFARKRIARLQRKIAAWIRRADRIDARLDSHDGQIDR